MSPAAGRTEDEGQLLYHRITSVIQPPTSVKQYLLLFKSHKSQLTPLFLSTYIKQRHPKLLLAGGMLHQPMKDSPPVF